jgi:hypothetical protein
MARDKYLANCETQKQICRNPPKRAANVVPTATNAVPTATNAVPIAANTLPTAAIVVTKPVSNAVPTASIVVSKPGSNVVPAAANTLPTAAIVVTKPVSNAVPVADSKPTTQPTLPKPTTQPTLPKPTTQPTVPKPTTPPVSILSGCSFQYGCCTRQSGCSKGGSHEVNKTPQYDDVYITKVSDNFKEEFLDYFGSRKSPEFFMKMLSNVSKTGPIDKIAYCKKCLKVFCPNKISDTALVVPVVSKPVTPTSKNICSFQYGCCAKDSGCSKGNGIHEETYIPEQDFDAKILDFQGSKESPKDLMDKFSKKSGVKIDKLSYCKNCLKVFCPDKISDKDFILSV